MKTWLKVLAFLAIGFLAVVPVTKFLITRNQVERELETSLLEYQTLTPEKFQQRVEKIATDNGLPPQGVKIEVTHPTSNSVSVSFRYEADFRVFFVPVHQIVAFKKGTTSLGM